MAWQDIVSKIKFWGIDGQPAQVNGFDTAGYGDVFNGPDRQEILDALKRIYDNSPTAQTLLESGVATRDIWLFNNTGSGGSSAKNNLGIARIDMNQARELEWMGRDGRFHLEDVGGHVIHELVHAIDGLYDAVDPTSGAPISGPRDYSLPGFDLIGPVQNKTNQILQETGLFSAGYFQVGYEAYINDSNSSFLDDTIAYTEDNSIKFAFFDNVYNKTPNVLDLSLRTDGSNDLIIGFGGEDRINGGAGRDYLYGSVDNDTISGGSGNDVLHGGDRVTAIASDGTDTADYSVGDNQAAPTHGVTVNIDVTAVADTDKIDGLTPIIVSDDGYGGRDRLVSIETIKLTDQADTVLIGAGSDVLLKGLKEIDAGGNGTGEKDILDFSKFDGTLTIADGKLIGTDISILIKNFEQVIGSSAGDTFNFAGTSVAKVEGGSGDDVITAGDAYAILLGGDGNDTLIAGSAGSVLDGGQSYGSLFDGGGNHYVGGAGADTFVIGNGADAKNGSDADFIISNASDADRLVLRLDDTLGFADAGNWTKGIVLNGGVETIGQGGVDPDQVYADFSSVLVNPQTIETNSDGAWITETALENVRPELGYFQVSYQWYKPESELFVFVQSAYGRFSVRVDGFENGELGLNFTDVSEPKLEAYHGSQSTVEIIDSWTPYHNAVQSLIQSTQIVDLPSPGEPIDGNVSPVTPYADIYWVPYPLHP